MVLRHHRVKPAHASTPPRDPRNTNCILRGLLSQMPAQILGGQFFDRAENCDDVLIPAFRFKSGAKLCWVGYWVVAKEDEMTSSSLNRVLGVI